MVSRSHLGLFPLLAVILLFGGTDTSWSQGRIGGAQIIINDVQGDLVSGSSGPVAQGDAVLSSVTPTAVIGIRG